MADEPTLPPCPPPQAQDKGRGPRKCSVCGNTGHDRRNCPTNPSNKVPPTATQGSKLDMGKCVFIIFDLETTGFSSTSDDIIELSADVTGRDGVPLEDGGFNRLVNPRRTIPTIVTELTGITDEMVSNEDTFDVAGGDFINFLLNTIDKHSETNLVEHLVLTAHNGNRFDIPFLLSSFTKHQVAGWEMLSTKYKIFKLDTMLLAKHAVQVCNLQRIPDRYRLSDLYQYVSGRELGDDAHRARADVDATGTVLRYAPFFACCRSVAQVLQHTPTVQQTEDSDVDEDTDDSTEGEEDENVQEVPSPMGGHWRMNESFEGVDTEPLFAQELSRRMTRAVDSDGPATTGLRCASMTVNTPIRAWKSIFTDSLLKKIVGYTNEYGEANCPDWEPVSVLDVTDFISCLFISGIQKRKDQPYNWFSKDPVRENAVMKKITTGRQFHKMMRYLHLCSLENQPQWNDPQYTPLYKVKEVLEYLEKRYETLYVPGQRLSLDESLIRAFGRIKFKIRIISKSARYGVKLYVLADAATAFVLRVIVYTGKSTYNDNDVNSESDQKTVQVVTELCKRFEGTKRTVYVDRFYTSIALMKAMDKMDLYVTGTVMANRVPKECRIAKGSKEFRNMARGAFQKHVFLYTDEQGRERKYGLVCWKDRNIVYGLTSEDNTVDNGTCHRRCKRERGGIIKITRPKLIENYNRYMGGVDVADQRRLQCNSTVMGQNRWWLKLFFYMLDVATSNALVLYKLATKPRNDNMTIKSFKQILVENFVGGKIGDLVVGINPGNTHSSERMEGRHKCVYCKLFFGRATRTRIRCSHPGCKIPLCSGGTGRGGNDCFSLCHVNEQVRLATWRHFQVMKLGRNRHCLDTD